MEQLNPSDVRAHVVKRFDFPVYSLGPWTPLGEKAFTPLGQFLHHLKYEPLSEREIALCLDNLVETMLPELKRIWPDKPADYCVAAPSNLRNSRKIPARIAEAIGSRTSIEFLPDFIEKTRPVRSVKRMSRENRARNLQGAFRASALPKGARGVLVIDDVFDSGSTLREIDRALAEARVSVPRHYVALAHIERPFSGWEVLA